MKTQKQFIVLVVEDSLSIIERIICMLEEVENIKLIVHAANYRESVKMIHLIDADIVLLDLNLPDKSGIELLRLIKNKNPESKIIVLTNHATDSYREVCNYMGSDYFFDKSNDFEKIPEIIKSFN
jgi:DNA-binding NarL/FixJ family response regulator